MSQPTVTKELIGGRNRKKKSAVKEGNDEKVAFSRCIF
jgi:hypothetical protein